MPLDIEIISFGIALFFVMLIVFFLMLRISNRLIAQKLSAMSEKQKQSEKLFKKFADIIIENRKETDRRIHALRKEFGFAAERNNSYNKAPDIEHALEESKGIEVGPLYAGRKR